MDENMAVSIRLQGLLMKARIKNKDFAEATGVTPETLSRYLHGKGSIPEEYIKKAAKELNISAKYLMGEEDVAINVQLHDSLKRLFEMLNENNHIVCYMLSGGLGSKHTITSSKHEIFVDGTGFIITNKETGDILYRLSVGTAVTSNQMLSPKDGTGIVSFICMNEKKNEVVSENVFILEKNIF